MKSEIVTIINNQFSDKAREVVTKELETISLEHVMTESDENLKNTHAAILKLAKGDVKEVVRLVECAKAISETLSIWPQWNETSNT